MFTHQTGLDLAGLGEDDYMVFAKVLESHAMGIT